MDDRIPIPYSYVWLDVYRNTQEKGFALAAGALPVPMIKVARPHLVELYGLYPPDA